MSADALGLVSSIADGGVAHFVDSVAYTSGQLFEWRNGGVAKASVEWDGRMTAVVFDGPIGTGAATPAAVSATTGVFGGDVVVANGNGVVIGHSALVAAGSDTAELQVLGTLSSDSTFMIGRWQANANAGQISFFKTRTAAIGGANATVVTGDALGHIRAYGDDGTDNDTLSSAIVFDTEGTIGTGQVPGIIRFQVAAAGSLADAVTIASDKAATFSGILSVDDTTDATSATSASIQTDGGIACVLDLWVGNDLQMGSSGAVINYNSGDVTWTHSAGKLTLGGDGAVEIDLSGATVTADIPASLVTAGTFGTGAYVFDDAVTGITALGVVTSLTLTGAAGAARIDINPGSDIDADLITVGVTGAPRLFWDESEDRFSFDHGFAVPAGAVGAAALSFAGDPNTGIYQIAGDSIGFTSGGTLGLTIAGAASPAATFAGTLAIAGNIGFYGQAATAKPTGVAVSDAAIHAALVTLNLIAA